MITAERLRQLLDYNPDTGVFVWRRGGSGVRVGDIAGTINYSGYRIILIGRRGYRAHRLAWLCVYGHWPSEIDHINRNKDDNRIANLRLATRSQNNMNVPFSRRNTSGYRGVSFHKRRQKYAANIRRDRKSYHLGYFDSPEAASIAYQKAAVELFGEFARTGE